MDLVALKAQTSSDYNLSKARGLDLETVGGGGPGNGWQREDGTYEKGGLG